MSFMIYGYVCFYGYFNPFVFSSFSKFIEILGLGVTDKALPTIEILGLSLPDCGLPPSPLAAKSR